MTSGVAPPQLEHAQVVHFNMEPFQLVAARELAAFPLVGLGVCLNPICSRAFAPARDWQRYCCDACRRLDEQEMRRIGQKAAPALLAWRMGKYEKKDEQLRAMSNAGRNYVSRLQSDWYSSRLARVAASGVVP